MSEMNKIIKLYFLLQVSFTLFGQNIGLDNTFTSPTSVDWGVNSINIQTDNKIIIVGGFSNVDGISRNGIARLNTNGTLDNSFDPGTGFSPADNFCSTIQADGKILVGGWFQFYNGFNTNGIARLNSDGTLDNTFNVGTGIMQSNGYPGAVRGISIQSDGKIILTGTFVLFNGVTVNNIVRLNTNGTIDNTFNSGTGFSGTGFSGGTTSCSTIQSDGKIIVTGLFNSYNGLGRNNIIRLNSDGTNDTSFNPGSGFNGLTFQSIIQTDGKIVINGTFTTFNGASKNMIARLNSDGTADNTFNIGSGFSGANASQLCLLPNGKIIVGGNFNSFNGIPRNNILRLNSNGTLDLTFDPGIGFDQAVSQNGNFAIRTQNDGKILIGGGFEAFNGLASNYLCRLFECANTVLNQTLNISACSPYNSPSNNQYTQTGTYNEILTNIYGCDSIHLTINLTIQNSQPSSSTITICDGDNYNWNGQIISNSGVYYQNLTNQYGCDSTIELIVNVNFNDNLLIATNPNPAFGNAPLNLAFSNQTTNLNNYNFTWYFGDGTSQQTNSPFLSHIYTINGYSDVTLVAQNTVTGCVSDSIFNDLVFVINGINCTHTATLNQSGSLIGCIGDSLLISCNVDPSFTYQWNKNGIPISNSNSSSFYPASSGTYSVTIFQNNCPVTSNGIVVIMNPLPQQPIINSSGTILPCSSNSVILSTPNTPLNCLWNTGANNDTIIVTQSGNYTVTITDSNGCSNSSNPYVINATNLPLQNICVVGVDSLTNNIRVVWEEPLTTAIDSFLIYKESNVSNVYTQVGSRAYDSLSVWIDPVSNPAVQAYRYKITALDTCGVETPLSDFHKTIHLTINQGVGGAWNLIWSHYEGINFGSYNIYRGTSSSNMTLLTTIQSNLNSYSDLTPPTGNVYYQVEIVNPNTCTPTKSTNYSSSKSNIVTNNQGSLIELSEEVMRIYPNPTNSELTIEISNGLIGKDYSITDFSGRELRRSVFNSTQEKIELNSLSNGVYFIQVRGSNIQQRLIKQ